MIQNTGMYFVDTKYYTIQMYRFWYPFLHRTFLLKFTVILLKTGIIMKFILTIW